MQLQRVEDQVIVITGASSGIGLTTARMAAERGAKLVLAARNEDALRQLVEEIRAKGGQAEYVVTDVGDESQIRNLAQRAVSVFGGFDTWINNAGVSVYGKMLDVDIADYRKLFDTNFWGVVYGSLEAARHLRRRKTPGAIINVGSEVSERAIPLQGIYSASKHAVKGFTDALRMELEKEGAPISVTLVKPGATDTPFPQHAKNYLDREPTLPPPVYAPDVVGETILFCCENPKRDAYAGASAPSNALTGWFLPRMTDWLMETFHFASQKSNQSPDTSDDALYEPKLGLQERGNYEGSVRETSVVTGSTWKPMVRGVFVLGTAALLAALAAKASASLTTNGGNGHSRHRG